MNQLPPKKNAPPPPATNKPAEAANTDPNRFSILSGKVDSAKRITVHGPGGVGKTTLASLLPNTVFIDLEGGTEALAVDRVKGVNTFADIRTVLQSDQLDGFDTIVLDSTTKIEEMALAHTLETVPHEKGGRVESIEGYGFGKGYQHLYDTFMLLLADLDSQVRRGRNIVLIAHSCIADVPNPLGEDFIRYEPQMQAPKSGKASIRNRVIQWCDSVLFLGYDVFSKDGKASGSGSRTIYTSELPTHIAKSRQTDVTLQFESPTDGKIWEHVLGGK